MSVIWNERDEAFVSSLGSTEDASCFVCCEGPKFPMMHWGGKVHIFLHPECFDSLYHRMLNDRLLILAEKKNKGL